MYITHPAGYVQPFPLQGNGGALAAMEAEVLGLHRINELAFGVDQLPGQACFQFTVVCVKRKIKGEYPFPIIEVGQSGDQPVDWYRQVGRHLNAIGFPKPDVIWCQYQHCPLGLQGIFDAPMIVTFHYLDGPAPNVDGYSNKVLYRLPSYFTYRLFRGFHPQLANYSFPLWEAFVDDEFDFNPNPGQYFLWVADCVYEKKKGLIEFTRFAREHPNEKFVFYCGNPETDQLARFEKWTSGIANLEYKGELMRGEPHHKAFREAKGFVFLTKMKETFGRTVVEALSKGTPVFATHLATTPELIEQDCGYVSNDMAEISRNLNRVFDRERVFYSSRHFRMIPIVQGLVRATGLLLRRNRVNPLEFAAFSEPKCLFTPEDGAIEGLPVI